jgi:hypothetical protein
MLTKMLTKMLTMTRTKDGPEFPGDYSSAKAPERIAAALERLAGAPPPCDFSAADAFVFAAGTATLPRVNRVYIGLLRGIDQARDILLGNTERFAQGFAANNALLWGARGMGKSALIKAVHATFNARLAASFIARTLAGCLALWRCCAASHGGSLSFATIFPSTRRI